jgi:hypothetical protein
MTSTIIDESLNGVAQTVVELQLRKESEFWS